MTTLYDIDIMQAQIAEMMKLRDAYLARAESLETERDKLRQKIEQVRSLAFDWGAKDYNEDYYTYHFCAQNILSILGE